MHCATLFGNIPIPCSVYKRKIRNEFEKKRVTRLCMAVSAFWKSCIFLISTNRPKLCPSETVGKTQTTVNLRTKKSILKVTFQLEKSLSSGPSLKRENRVSNFNFPPVPLPLTFLSRSGRLGQNFRVRSRTTKRRHAAMTHPLTQVATKCIPRKFNSPNLKFFAFGG